MPRWETHLEIAERLNKSLKFQEKDKEAFFLGNILPDINSGYLISNVSKIIDKDFTHFYWNETPPYETFQKKYYDKIRARDPLFLGVTAHLFTDYYWNEDFHKRAKNTYLYTEKDQRYRLLLKQGDFWIFNNNFKRDNQKLIYPDYLTKKANEVEEISITEDDLEKVINYLNKGDLTDNKYQFYRPEQLNNLLNDTVIKIKDHLETL